MTIPEASNLYNLIGMLLQASEKNVDFETSGQITIIILLFFIFFSKPAISKQEKVHALIFSLNASTVDGGVTSHQAIVSLLSRASAVDRGALPGEH